MTVHPDPPPDFARRRLLIRPFRGDWWRIHRSVHGALLFGRAGTNRFDAPAGEFGVLYVGRDAHCAFIETFGHATGVRFVTRSELAARDLSLVSASRPLRLVDLRAEGLARMGADGALTSGLDYGLSHRWALAIHEHPRAPDGVVYRARHDPGRTSAAIFERAASALSVRRVSALDDPSLAARLGDILDTYDFGLAP